jgi:hypothetical protein
METKDNFRIIHVEFVKDKMAVREVSDHFCFHRSPMLVTNISLRTGTKDQSEASVLSFPSCTHTHTHRVLYLLQALMNEHIT